MASEVEKLKNHAAQKKIIEKRRSNKKPSLNIPDLAPNNLNESKDFSSDFWLFSDRYNDYMDFREKEKNMKKIKQSNSSFSVGSIFEMCTSRKGHLMDESNSIFEYELQQVINENCFGT